jgi:hypothetical protein
MIFQCGDFYINCLGGVTRTVWVYDLRTHIRLPLRRSYDCMADALADSDMNNLLPP